MRRTQYPGVYYREHAVRKHGRQKDRYLIIKYQIKGVQKTEAVGWTSEGWTAQDAAEQLARIKRAARTGEGPTSLAAIRAQAEADRKHEELAAARVSQGPRTFADLARGYLDWARDNKRSWTEDRGRFENHILPLLGVVVAADMARADVERLQKVLASKRVRGGGRMSPATQLQCLALVRQVYNWAAVATDETGQVLHAGANPAQLSRRYSVGVQVPVIDNGRLRIVTPAEAQRWIDACCGLGEDLPLAVLLGLDLGLRLGELVSLTWQAVDFERQLVRVVPDMRVGDSVGRVKSNRGRTVYLGQLMPEAPAALLLRRETTPGPWVFPARNPDQSNEPEGHLQRSHLGTRLVRAADLVGLNLGVTDNRWKVVAHTMRHSCATWLLERGLDVYAVKVLMGHASISTTERYLHLCDQKLRAMALGAGDRASRP